MHHAIFDIEIVGKERPVFLLCGKIVETKETFSIWFKDIDRIRKLLPLYTWVGFNSENFDRPILAAALDGWDEIDLKSLAEYIIQNEMRSWQTYREFGISFVEYDHIDLMEVPPGVKISLKTYAGRMHYPTMIDMPFAHDQDLMKTDLATLEQYCLNDLGVTEKLFKSLKAELAIRSKMSQQYDIDLRSKSDAQMAEAILKKQLGLTSGKSIPVSVSYKTPDFIRTDNAELNTTIKALEAHSFSINPGNGSPEFPEFLNEPIVIGSGTYQMGIGGLHSTHDKQLYLEETDKILISDFDVASYYPSLIIKAGLVPMLSGNKGQRFMELFHNIYLERLEAKRSGDKKKAKVLKIVLNGTFGKLGSRFCSFYSPDLMLAVTISGQLNLLCLVHELEKIKDVYVKSANTDGVLVVYPPNKRKQVLKVFADNNKATGFEYEETPYKKYAAKDVNNYIAIKHNDSAKRKGLYAVAGLMENKNPTMEVCSNSAVEYLLTGTLKLIGSKVTDYLAVRNVQGGGVQHEVTTIINDWEHTDEGWIYPGMTTKPVKRKSPPEPREVGTGGKPFGRVARWYMTTQKLPPISYVKSGNKVPKTEGAKLCLTLPNKLPKDLDKKWYLNETRQILLDCGVQL